MLPPHHPNPHTCIFTGCNYTTKKLGNLRRHAVNIHKSSSSYICKYCVGMKNRVRKSAVRKMFYQLIIMAEISQLSECCQTIDSYKTIMNEVPITNIGRACVCFIFTMAVLKRKPALIFGVSKYWIVRAFQNVQDIMI